MSHQEKIFHVLQQVSSLSPSAVNKQKYPIVAAIVLKKDIKTIGVAKRKTHTLQKKHGVCPDAIYLHAEIDALQKAIRMELPLHRCEIYVLRQRKFDVGSKIISGYGLAKPCGFDDNTGCTGAIRTFDLKNAIYTIDSIDLAWESFY